MKRYISYLALILVGVFLTLGAQIVFDYSIFDEYEENNRRSMQQELDEIIMKQLKLMNQDLDGRLKDLEN